MLDQAIREPAPVGHGHRAKRLIPDVEILHYEEHLFKYDFSTLIIQAKKMWHPAV